MKRNEYLCHLMLKSPDLVETRFTPDEKTRRGPLVLYKAVSTVYEQVDYITIPQQPRRDEKGRLILDKPMVIKERSKPVFMIEL